MFFFNYTSSFGYKKINFKEEIFINASSFRLMYELNKLVKQVYGSSSEFESRTKREILAVTLIEYMNKINTTLGIWSQMNIEIVTKKDDVIDFFPPCPLML